MKKIIFTLILSLSINSAFAVMPVFDGGNFGQQLLNYAKQGLQYSKDIVTAASSQVSAYNDELRKYNEILARVQSAAVVLQMVRSGEIVQKMITGATGVDPLLIRNPEKYVKLQGQLVTRSVLEDSGVKQAVKEGRYEASIMGNVLSKAKYDALNLNQKIDTINTSNLTSNAQQQLCTDAALSLQAKKDVADSDGTYDQAAYTARKQALNAALCTGDPTKGQTKANILAANTKNPTWGSFLQVTGGDNDYTKSVYSQLEIEKKAKEKEEEKKKTLETNGSIKDQTKCLEYVVPGNPEYGCKEGKERIVKTADVTNNAFKKSLQNPQDLLLAGYGKDITDPLRGIITMAGTAYTTIGLLTSLGNSIGIGNDGVGGGGYFSDGTGGTGGGFVGGGTGSNVSVTTEETQVNDLIGRPENKAAMIEMPKQLLTTQKKGLNDLIKADTSYLSSLNNERSLLESLRSCYSTLLGAYPELQTDSRITTANNYYQEKYTANDTKFQAVSTEKEKAAQGIAVIEGILQKIETSQSSQEIANLTMSSSKSLEAIGIPDSTVGILRQGEQAEHEQTVEQMRTTDSPYSNYMNTCTQIRQEKTGGRGGVY